MAEKDDLGRRGEDLAARWAVEQGWQVLERNWRGEGGELDLVARDGGDLVMVEVKTRSTTTFGDPITAVTPAKVARMRRLTGQWLTAHAVAPRVVRLDVVGILWPRGAAPTLTHVPGVGW
ncbi:YraN family protein [Litorihabitans aurantiacus]|uniref:UPF0102 protein GCM10025875_17990 n=1 Tax=Litorihabitans aurantiacus TaxID=1930061 RepID=A0AA37XEQ5_9MICO|nr:YraN family protein [Litorihabitans aurantiacus]GMA31807.1 UPF0102 protein [Litorihabitans aurantiacus]